MLSSVCSSQDNPKHSFQGERDTVKLNGGEQGRRTNSLLEKTVKKVKLFS